MTSTPPAPEFDPSARMSADQTGAPGPTFVVVVHRSRDSWSTVPGSNHRCGCRCQCVQTPTSTPRSITYSKACDGVGRVRDGRCDLPSVKRPGTNPGHKRPRRRHAGSHGDVRRVRWLPHQSPRPVARRTSSYRRSPHRHLATSFRSARHPGPWARETSPRHHPPTGHERRGLAQAVRDIRLLCGERQLGSQSTCRRETPRPHTRRRR